MADSASEHQVLRRLKDAFAKDQTQPTILDFTALGLVQIARKRTGLSLSQTLCAPSNKARTQRVIKSNDTLVFEILRQLSREAASSSSKTVEIHASPAVIEQLQKKYSVQIKQYESIAECSVKLYPQHITHCDEFNIIST